MTTIDGKITLQSEIELPRDNSLHFELSVYGKAAEGQGRPRIGPDGVAIVKELVSGADLWNRGPVAIHEAFVKMETAMTEYLMKHYKKKKASND